MSVDTIERSITFARMAKAAYRDRGFRTQPGLAKLRHEFRFEDELTDTQGFAATWNNEVVIAFRGTEKSFADWLGTNAQVGFVRNPWGDGHMHTGFRRAADSVYQKLKFFVRHHRSEDSRVFLCGHSLGAALAVITAVRMSNDSQMPDARGVFTYGSPRVGDAVFAEEYRRLGLHDRTTAWVTKDDPVSHVPPFAFCYQHVTEWGLQLNPGTCSRIKLDAKSRTKTELEWIADVPATRRLYWLARNLDDLLKAAKRKHDHHSMQRGYLPQLLALRRSLPT